MPRQVTINLIGEIGSVAHAEFLEQITAARTKKAEVRVVINSEGGSATDAMAIAALIRRYPIPVSVHATGLVASAATIILAAGAKKQRSMDSTAWAMIHEEQVEISGSVSEVLQMAQDFKRREQHWCQLLSQYTGQPAFTWENLQSIERYLSPEECRDLGLVDTIVEIK